MDIPANCAQNFLENFLEQYYRTENKAEREASSIPGHHNLAMFNLASVTDFVPWKRK